MEWTISVNVSRRNGKESWGWEIRSWDELGFEYTVAGGVESSAEFALEDVAGYLRQGFNGE
jgi:hypothetical protein